MTIATSSPVPMFFDLDGSPLASGSVYYGQPNQNPETAPITVYWDAACTQPVAQPVKTVNGYPSRQGAPANVYANSDYSITVKNKLGKLIIYMPLATQFGNAGQIGAVISSGQTVTVNVPSQYTDVKAAFDAVASWVILGTLKIQVADGTYNWTRSQLMNHPYGKNIQVLGNVTTPTNCVIRGTNPPTFDMFVTSNGHQLGYFDGIFVDAISKATLANNYTGLLASQGATIICGTKVRVNNWYYGIAARNGSHIYCRYAQVSNAGDVGIWAMNGSSMDAQYATSTGASDTTNNWGWGFEAEYGSFLDCSNGSASSCNIAGIGALSNSTVRALSATASNNVGSGMFASMDGAIECNDAIANNNGRYGAERILGGVIVGGNFTTTGNTLGAYQGYAYFDNGNLGARIAANGALRIDNNGTASTFFNTSGGLQAEVRHLADAAAHWVLQGGGPSTSGQPILATDGTATDVDGRVQLKGAARLFFNNSNGTQAEIGAGEASTVNHPYFEGAATGKAAKIGAAGADAVVDLALVPKGVGSYVQVMAGSFPVTTETVQKFMTIRDESGALCKIAILV